MSHKVQPIPAGYHSITPYLIMAGADQAIVFYQKAFGAQEMFRLPGPDGKVMHAEIKLGDSVVMLADEFPDMGAIGPARLGGSPVHLLLYVPNVDQVVDQALAVGAVLKKPLQDQFYGDRSATVMDPFGHQWTIATHVEDVAPEAMQKRFEAIMQQG